MKTFVLLIIAKVDDFRYFVPYIVEMKLTAKLINSSYPQEDLGSLPGRFSWDLFPKE